MRASQVVAIVVPTVLVVTVGVVVAIYFLWLSKNRRACPMMWKTELVVHRLCIAPLDTGDWDRGGASWRQHNPAARVVNWSLSDVRQWVQTLADADVYLHVLDALRHPALKADFAGALIVLHQGGFRVDSAQKCVGDLERLRRHYPVVCFRDADGVGLDTTFFGAAAHNSFLHCVVNQMVHTVRAGRAAPCGEVTGPSLWGRMYRDAGFDKTQGCAFAPYTFRVAGEARRRPDGLCSFVAGGGVGSVALAAGTHPSTDAATPREPGNRLPPLLVPGIPRVLHKTGPAPSAADLPAWAWADIGAAHPGMEMRYHNNADCERLIATHFDATVLQAYQQLVPTAFRADLFRYCLLYVHGGLYMDLPYCPVVSLDSIVDFANDSLLLARDRCSTRSDFHIQISFMASRPRHPTLLHAIRKVVANVQERYYGTDALDVTGPGLFKKALVETSPYFRMPVAFVGLVTKTIVFSQEPFCLPRRDDRAAPSGVVAVTTRPPRGADYVKMVYGSRKRMRAKKYGNLWTNRRIYAPRPPPAP